MKPPIIVEIVTIEGNSYTKLMVEDSELGNIQSMNMILWTDNQLYKRGDVHRSMWNEWIFETKEAAEKFKLLWMLRWSEY